MDKFERKAAQLAFKEKKILMGVLCIKNLKQNIVYLKGSVNLEALSNKILFMLKNNQFDNPLLQEHWNLWGEQEFVFEYVRVITPEKDRIVDYRKMVKKEEDNWGEKLKDTTEFY